MLMFTTLTIFVSHVTYFVDDLTKVDLEITPWRVF